jgi:glutathione synthase
LRIGFVVNDVQTESPSYTAVRLATTAENLGHEAWFMGVGDFAYDNDDHVRARARRMPKRKGARFPSSETYARELRSDNAVLERITVDDLDVLMLRSDPGRESDHRAWAHTAGINFGRLAMRHGVTVLNDPNGLARALNKTYLQYFPAEVRPKTLITRDRDEIADFASEHGNIVLKPLQGSGGKGVFLVRPDDMPNLNQMVEAVSRDGYVMAQEYLTAAAEGDTRLLLMNGKPLQHEGRIAAFRRTRSGGDIRSNIRTGGKIRKAEIDERVLRIAEVVRPKLVQDGMFLVGLDIVGEKLMEINVYSPGGLGSAQRLEGVDFTHAIIDALEHKCLYMGHYHRNFDNVEMATL